MGKKVVIGPIDKGLRNDVTPFNIDNDSFPTLTNAYQWRGRVKRKRGTLPFTRLAFQKIGAYSVTAAISYYNSIGNTTAGGAITAFNIKSTYSLASKTSIVPFSIKIVFAGTAQNFTDNGLGVLTGSTGGTGYINYQTGVFSLQTSPVLNTIAAYLLFSYYPSSPVMGLEPFVEDASVFPQELGFDQTKSYNISLSKGTQNLEFSPYQSWNVSYYRNPGVKNDWTPVQWNLASYQQMWTTNYAGALWAVPGIRSPFDSSVVGMQFSAITLVANVTPTTVDLTVTGANLVPGDYVFLNEFDAAVITGINFETGVITAGTAPGVITVSIPTATLAGAGGATVLGIVQYLTTTQTPPRIASVGTMAHLSLAPRLLHFLIARDGLILLHL